MPRPFDVALRGYDRDQVDALLDRAELALGGGLDRYTVATELRSARFRSALRGYDRDQVDQAIDDAVSRLGG